MTVDLHANLSQALRKQRNSLFSVCFDLGIDPKLVDPDKLSVKACDWCNTWCFPKSLTDEDGTLYCKICMDAEYYTF